MGKAPPLVAALVGLAIVASGAAAEPAELELDRVVAVIDREVILASELQRRVDHATTTRDAADPRRAMLWAMIDERLLVKLALASQLTASEQEIDQAIRSIRQQNQLSDEELTAALAQQGYAPDEYREAIRRQLLAARAINLMVRPQVSVSSAEIEALHGKRVAEGAETRSLEDAADELRGEITAAKLDLERDRLAVELRREAYIDIRLPVSEAAK
jgi:peptidyl-prolyl cis-trans isomerase SurA